MALLSNQPRNATVRTVTATKLALIGKRNFITMLGVLPSARREILRTVQQRSVRGPIGRKK
jgi:CRP-like cAMP-binding protein